MVVKLRSRFARHAHDGVLHGRGEHENAPLGVHRLEDRVDLLRETHVEHLVGLVEHEELDVGKIELSALDHVDDPCRGAHHHVHSPFQGPQLQADGLAAVDGDGPRMGAMAQRGDLRVHLDGQLPRGHQDERAQVGGRLGQPLDQRETECRGLSRSRAGARNQVAVPREEEGNGQRLDRGRFLEPLLLEHGEGLLAEPQRLETGRCH